MKPGAGLGHVAKRRHLEDVPVLFFSRHGEATDVTGAVRVHLAQNPIETSAEARAIVAADTTQRNELIQSRARRGRKGRIVSGKVAVEGRRGDKSPFKCADRDGHVLVGHRI